MVPEADLHACHCCGLAQLRPTLTPGQWALCARCHTPLPERRHAQERNRSAAGAALAALLLFPLAVSLPVLEIERFGHRRSSSILSGVGSLFTDGQWLVGLVVLLCSIVLPALKLAGLLLLTLGPMRLWLQPSRARLWRWIEFVGRWGMLDVLLVALLVATLKLGDLVSVRAGEGLVAFVCMVAASLLSSTLFDPHALWDLPPGSNPVPEAHKQNLPT
jgi:paraquat-inducible protein A